jgi:PIN domain nuclease of toxin-antitoxin system
MTYLLDTHAFLWWLFDDPKLPATVRGFLADPANRVLVSSASAWEIATKHRLGRLSSAGGALVQDIPGWIARAGFHELVVTVAHAQRAGSAPQRHRDPFDRMLAAQGAIEDVPLVTSDPAFAAFGVKVIW